MKIQIGRSLKSKTAEQAKAILDKRYPKNPKEVAACIKLNFEAEEETDKLNPDGNSSTTKSESKDSTK